MKFIVYFTSDYEVIEADEEDCLLGSFTKWTIEQWRQVDKLEEVHIQVIYNDKLEDCIVLQVVPHACDTSDTVAMLRAVVKEKHYRPSKLLKILPDRVRSNKRQTFPPMKNLETDNDATDIDAVADAASHGQANRGPTQRSESLSGSSGVVCLPPLPTLQASGIAEAYDGTMAQSTVRKLQNRTSMAPPPEPQSIDSPAFERLHPQAALNSSGSSTPTRHPSRQFSCTPTSAPRASFSREQLRQPAQLCLSWKRKPEARLRLVGTRLYCLQLLSIRELMKLKATIESSSLRGAAAAPTLEIPFGLPVANEADLNSAVEKISASAEAKTALKKCLGPSVTQSVRYAMNELLARDFQQRFNRTGGKDARGRGQQENSKMSFDKCFGGIVKDALGSSFTLHDINKAIERFFDGVRKRRSHEGSAESDVAGGHGAPTPSRRRSTMRVQRISDSTDEENM
uniref:SAWADEE domain-containing protein n=1 Tax=Macrostomum lignano TaxID=282301 RepID=A0A1I8GBW3_9PLAT